MSFTIRYKKLIFFFERRNQGNTNPLNCIFLNGEKLNLDYNKINPEDIDYCDESLEIYLSQGFSEEYAKTRACLSFAPYTDVDSAQAMLFIDEMVLSLAGLTKIKIKSPLKNVIKLMDSRVSYKNKRISLPIEDDDIEDTDFLEIIKDLLTYKSEI